METTSTLSLLNVSQSSLNPYETEFLLIGRPKQPFKVNDAALLMPSNVTITPFDLAH